MKVHGKWSRLTRGLLRKHNNKTLFTEMRFARLINKYVLYTARQKRFNALTALRRLSMKLIQRYYGDKQFTANTNLARLARKLYDKNKYTPAAHKKATLQIMGRWNILTHKLLMRHN